MLAILRSQHLHAVVTLMRVSKTWHQFKLMLDQAHPKRWDTLQRPDMPRSKPEAADQESLFEAKQWRGRQLRRPSVHAGGGSMSGATGLRSGCAPGSSTCSLRSAALSNRAAEILGSLVALANLKRIAA